MAHVPEPWTFVLLALAAYRLTRLVGWDVITRPLREPATGRKEKGGAKDARDSSKGTRRPWHRPYFDDFIHCPFCQGFWICVARLGPLDLAAALDDAARRAVGALGDRRAGHEEPRRVAVTTRRDRFHRAWA